MKAIYRILIPTSIYVALFSISIPWIYQTLLNLTGNDDNNAPVSWFSMSLSTFLVGMVSFCMCGLLLHIYRISFLRYDGPIPLPIICNCLSLVETNGLIQDSIQSLIRTYGSVVDLLLLDGDRIVIVNDPTACRTIFMKSTDRGDMDWKNDAWELNLRKSFLFRDAVGNLGLDLFSQAGLPWKTRRRIIQPAFDQAHVRQMQTAIIDTVHEFVSRLKEHCQQQETTTTFDIFPMLQDYTFQVMARTLLGLSQKQIDQHGRFIIDFMTLSMQCFQNAFIDPILWTSLYILPHIGLNPTEVKREKQATQFRTLLENLVKDEIKRQENNKEITTTSTNSNGETNGKDKNHDAPKMDNLLSLLVSASLKEKPSLLPFESLLDELSSLIFAGYDTTSVTLGNLLHHIGTHEHVQEKLQKELDSVLDDNSNSNKDFAAAASSLVYLSACIRESQRLQSVTSVLTRRTSLNVTVQQKNNNGSKIIIPKDTKCMIPIMMLQRDPTVYHPDPNAYNPDRWIDNNDNKLKSTTPGYYYAFGGGPKMCVGIQLAEREVKLSAMAILYHFRVKVPPEFTKLEIHDHFVTGPTRVMVQLEPRK